MEKIELKVSMEPERLDALRYFLQKQQKGSPQKELERALEELYETYVPRTPAPTWTAGAGRLRHGPGQSVQHGARRLRVQPRLRLMARGRTESSREKGAHFVAASASVCPAVLRGRAGIPPTERRLC